jgi:hypothetical protein
MSIKKKEKQDARDTKRFDEIISGKTKIVCSLPKKKAQANRKGGSTPTPESEAEMVSMYSRLLIILLPGLMIRLSSIDDPREKNKCDHTLPTLILYGIVMFLAFIPSRRAANREIGRESAFAVLTEIIPEIESIPHADTLSRLLKRIDVDKLETYYGEILTQFIDSKSFLDINPGQCLIAVDGTHKFSLDYCFDKRALVRNAGDEEKERHYVYMLESSLILENGIVLPLLTETMENDGTGLDVIAHKQDCESKAFHRLAGRLEKLIGKGRATIILDGLYANGPIISKCNQYGWGYMIVLKSGCLPSVWEEFNGLRKIEPDNTVIVEWGSRFQSFSWSNGIEYIYGNNHKKLLLNVVTCEEKWVEMNPRKGKGPIEMTVNYAWLSSEAITEKNVINLCNRKARWRWRLENLFLIEKHQGYNYTHIFSYNWDAMRGFHYLMKFAHFINTLISHSSLTQDYVSADGISGFIKKVWQLILYSRLQIEIKITRSQQNKRLRINFNALKLSNL